MKLFFLLVVVPVMAVLAQKIAVKPAPVDVVVGPPIIKDPPPDASTTSASPFTTSDGPIITTSDGPFITTSPNSRIIPKTQFVAIAPFRIRQGKPFNVFVTRFGEKKAISVKITITGKTESGANFTTIVKYANIHKSSTNKLVTIDTAKIQKGEYFLIIEGEGYTDKRALTYALKDSSVLIQLNKAIFSPGQLVQGRLFAFNSETNAISPRDKCIITISDPDNTAITSFSNITFTKGKYELQFQLADRPPLGSWSINAQCGNEYAKQSFQVDEYKLPAYEVVVTIPNINPLSNGKVPVEITAQYTFGDPVTGNGVLSIDNYYSTSMTRQVSLVNGHASFELDMQSDLQVQPYGNYYNYMFSMNDSILNSAAFTQGSFQVNPYSYYIELSGSQFLSPGSTYAYTVTVRKFDDTPAPAGTQVTVTIYPGGQQQNVSLTAGGSASSSIAIPADTYYLSLNANAKDAQNGYLYAYAASSGSISSIGLTVATQEPKLNEYVRVVASVGEDISYIDYFISSKGLLLAADKLSFSTGKRTASIWFKPDFTYAPFCSIVAFYINKAGDFVVGQTTVQLNDKLPNYVKLNFSDVEVKPGVNYTFKVESKCDSTISLTAIDQRVLLLKSGNEFGKQDVFNKLLDYQNVDGMIYENRYYPNYEWQFYSASVIPITNIPPPPPPQYYYYSTVPASRPETQPQTEGPSKGAAANDVKVRKDFSETFCWTDVVTKSSSSSKGACKAKLTCKVPDSITKYLVYSVAMNTKYGMGLTEVPSNITTKLPFFMVMETPYSVMRNETLTLDIAFFNSINQNQNITITITKTDKFVGVDLASLGWTDTSTGYVKTFPAKASTNFKLQFSLKYISIGIFNFKIVAKGPLAGDGIEKPIRVIPEGIPRTTTSTTLIAVNSNAPVNTSLQCVYPDGAYEDTKQVLATIIGDLLGTALNNLEQLIQMPGGCGEQTLIMLVPDLCIHQYLKATGKLTPAIEAKLIQYEQDGVQNQLTYKRSDGGFSAFGNSDPASSTWLTAYTLKAFAQAREYISIDQNVIQGAIDFVMSQQRPDGSFAELGRVIHVDMQGGAGNGTAMTAYIVSVLSKLIAEFPQYQSNYILAINYLAAASSSITDVYDLGIVAYALKLAGRSEATGAFNSFFALKVESPTTIQWQKTSNPPPYAYTAPSLDIEISSYGLDLCLLFNKSSEAIKVVKYLTGQSNKFGGYGSTQDTVVALGAMSLFATTYSLNSDVSLVLTPNAGSPVNAAINATNVLTLQQFELNQATTKLNVAAKSKSSGLAIVSLICNYYQDPSKVIPFFTVTTEFYRQCRYSIGFRVCSSYIPAGNSNMAIVSVKMPSGYQYQEWWGGPNNPDVSKTEVTNQGTLVTFYFNTIGNEPSCVDVNAYRYTLVTELKGGNVIVNDYYDTSKEGTAKYDVPDLSGPCWYY